MGKLSTEKDILLAYNGHTVKGGAELGLKLRIF